MIAGQNGFAKDTTIETAENLIEIIKRSLENGEDVLARGFSKFRSKKREASAGFATRPPDLT